MPPTRPLLAGLALAACASQPPFGDPGENLFSHESAGEAGNVLTCAFCHPHPTQPAQDDAIRPGVSLAGVASRGAWWDGELATLEEAIDACRHLYMRKPPEREDGKAETIAAWLRGLGGRSGIVELPDRCTDKEAIEVIPGDPAAGAGLYDRACARCHGTLAADQGRLLPEALDLLPGIQHPGPTPDGGVAGDGIQGDYPFRWRHVVCSGVRDTEPLGTGFVSGVRGESQMPFFLDSLLSQQQLADIVAFWCDADPGCAAEAAAYHAAR